MNCLDELKIGYSRDLNTSASSRPIFLAKEEGKPVQRYFLDANLIRVAPKCRDTAGPACLYRPPGRSPYLICVPHVESCRVADLLVLLHQWNRGHTTFSE
jgi:hypothetical protein